MLHLALPAAVTADKALCVCVCVCVSVCAHVDIGKCNGRSLHVSVCGKFVTFVASAPCCCDNNHLATRNWHFMFACLPIRWYLLIFERDCRGFMGAECGRCVNTPAGARQDGEIYASMSIWWGSRGAVSCQTKCFTFLRTQQFAEGGGEGGQQPFAFLSL